MMRAITIQQPWAGAAAEGIKPVDNRARGTTYRGPLAIHASRRPSDEAIAEVLRITGRTWDDVGSASAQFGVVLAVVDLVDCHRAAGGCCAPWGHAVHPGRRVYHAVHLAWTNVRRLTVPVPCRGSLGVWAVPPAVEELVTQRLAVAA